ncbi:DUF2461 domain-containing protein [Rubripirellula sp.]|jgi:uncharacterized protein (TIGR02453 family)|nr:DUF2461 domain-containing protein [Planctomycetaceae bacterium]MDA9857804.1 DUF2461 domain-containing protein [Rubripirellula sp.]
MTKSPIQPALFEFLEELKRNNRRDWFAENKERYQRDVRDASVELVRALQRPLAKAAPMLEGIAKGHGGSVLRIYKDTRFSKDKTPYKTNVGISLRHQANRNIHAPGVYIHLAADECLVGCGSWRPERNVLFAIRAAIDQEPKRWVKVRDQKTFRQYFHFTGESLKTAPRDYPKTHPLIEDLRRIDCMAVAPLTRSEITGDNVVELLIDRIKRATPLMRFLCDAIDLPY